MGAWGSASFENDAALDFAGEIATLDDLQKPLLDAASVEQIDADEASKIIVVAECMAAKRGHPGEGFPDDLAKRLKNIDYSQMVNDDARNMLSAVIARSELSELWAEDDPSEWNRAMTDLIERLGRPMIKPGAKKKKPAKKVQNNASPCSFCGKPMGPGAFTQFDITLEEDEISSVRQGGWAHVSCLNAALHPKFMIQHWKFDDEEIDAAVEKLLGREPDTED